MQIRPSLDKQLPSIHDVSESKVMLHVFSKKKKKPGYVL